MSKQVKIITKPILILGIISLLTDVASEMLYPIMPIYLKSIGFSVLLIGILEGFVEALAGISKGYFGNLSDHKNKRKPFISSGYTLSALSKPLLALSSLPVVVFITRSLDRLGKGIRTSARDAFLSESTRPEFKGRVFGFHRGMDTFGAAIGPLIAILFMFLYPGNFKMLFLIAFIPGFFASLLTFILHEHETINSKQTQAKSRTTLIGFLKYWKKSSEQYKIIVIGLLLFALFNSTDYFLLLVINEKGYNNLTVIGIYIIYNLAYALLSFPIGSLGDKIGLRKILPFGLIMFSIMYIFIHYINSLTGLILLFLIYSIYAASTDGISKAMITNVTDKKDSATGLGFYNCFASIIALIASAIGGLLWYQFSSKIMFLFSGIGALLAGGYFLIWNNKLFTPELKNTI